MQRASHARGIAPGEVSQEVDVLEHCMQLAEEFHVSDQEYLNQLTRKQGSIRLSDLSTSFGLKLTGFISSMSDRMRPINLIAAYESLRWSMGVLSRKVLDDKFGPAKFHSTLAYLSDELSRFPERVNPASEQDGDLALKLQKLKRLFNQVTREFSAR